VSPDVAASVKARLLARSKASGEEFERILVRYADERFLYRLGVSQARDRCILKGASLLSAWLSDPYRATRDIDVLSFGPPDDAAIRAVVTEICIQFCPQDGLRFDLSNLSVEQIRGSEDYAGKRARLVAYLGTARIRLQMDFGFGDALASGPDQVELPTLLVGLPRPQLLAYPRDASIAEKLDAMVTLDTRNSRMKDFHDIWALSTAFTFRGAKLQRAIAACFQRRGTVWDAEIPRGLTPLFYEMPELQTRWRRYLAAGAVLIPPPGQFEVIGERIIRFLGPVWDSIVAGIAFNSIWEPGGPWR
jgi:hypothetical protein